MGERVSDRAVVQADADVVREIVFDLDAYPEWAEGVSRATALERDEQGRPLRARFEVDAKVVQFRYVIAYAYTDERIAWTLVEGDALSQLDGSYVLTPAGEGATDVAYTVEVDVSIPLPGFLKKRAAKQVVESGLRNLQRRAEDRAR